MYSFGGECVYKVAEIDEGAGESVHAGDDECVAIAEVVKCLVQAGPVGAGSGGGVGEDFGCPGVGELFGLSIEVLSGTADAGVADALSGTGVFVLV